MPGRAAAALSLVSLLSGTLSATEVRAQRRGAVHETGREARDERGRIEKEARRERWGDEQRRREGQDVLLRRIGVDRSDAKARLGIYDRSRQFYAGTGPRRGLTAFRVPQAAPSSGSRAPSDRPFLAHLYALFGRPTGNRPDAATALLGPALSPGVAVFSGVPVTREQFRSVFGGGVEASRTALDALRAGSAALKRIEGTHVAVTSARAVVEAIRSAPESTIILVGHNEGGTLISPAGDRLPLGDIARSCARYGKLCVFLSCKAARHVPGAHGPTVDISPLQASRIAKRIAAMLATQPLKPLQAVVPAPSSAPLVYGDPWRVAWNVDAIIAAETTGRTRLLYIGVSVGGTVLVAMLMVEMLGECDDGAARCPS